MNLDELTSVYIFGAQSRALTLKGYLDCLAPHCAIIGFLVGDDDKNPKKIGKIPVINILENPPGATDVPVLIATKGIHHERISSLLKESGVRQIVPVTPKLENRLRNSYIKRVFRETNCDIPFLEETDLSKIPTAHIQPVVYMVRSIYDLPMETRRDIPGYMQIIQGGAALTDMHIAPLRDDDGANISLLNRQFNENTVLYWIWRNTADPWVGLCHYRRWFTLSPETVRAIPNTGFDVILPSPTLAQPSVSKSFSVRHGAEHWEFMVNWLKSHMPGYYATAAKLFCGAEYFGNLYFPCNMFIAKREVMDGYCEWLFPILAAVAENGGEKDDAYENRYIGTISERLLTLYFMHNREKIRIALADKRFYS